MEHTSFPSVREEGGDESGAECQVFSCFRLSEERAQRQMAVVAREKAKVNPAAEARASSDASTKSAAGAGGVLSSKKGQRVLHRCSEAAAWGCAKRKE